MTTDAATTLPRRLALASPAVATVGAGLLVHAFGADPLADVAGDALYTVLIYLLAAFALPRARPVIPMLLASAVCTAIELLQLTDIPRDVATAFPPAALALGSGFDARDLVVYALAAATASVIDAIAAPLSSENARGRPPEGERPLNQKLLTQPTSAR